MILWDGFKMAFREALVGEVVRGRYGKAVIVFLSYGERRLDEGGWFF